jgi:hypothetical protein
LQPFDAGGIAPYLAQNDWVAANPGLKITVHNFASLTITASFAVRNKMAAFCKPGIWPFSRLTFNDDIFLSVK